jgi:ATP-binding cassette subfamily C (CFTR/MRP) protein 1
MEQEAAHEISESKPHPEWPETGAIEFKDLEMRYRPGLPNILHGISMSIRGGEKIGIVGRTLWDEPEPANRQSHWLSSE